MSKKLTLDSPTENNDFLKKNFGKKLMEDGSDSLEIF